MKKKIIIIVLGIVAAVIGIAVVFFVGKVNKYNEYMDHVQIEEVDLNQIEDGTYEGYSDAGAIIVRLEVTVKDHVMTDITLLQHDNGQGSDAEAIIDNILEEQRIDVDTISGATSSSRVIQDTIEKALLRK
jgi:uncharacterized protein with FMN-binding domain